jgi:alpha-amylase
MTPQNLFIHTGRAALVASLLALGPLFAAETSVPAAVPRLTHPGAGQTLYFVLTDRFANGRTDNDTGGYPGGPDDHGFDPTRISHYHGGDFAGLTAHLDYLKELGVTAVWVTPPFKNKPVQQGTAGYHGYWTLDFTRIDPHLGTNDEYREFIRQAHARGLRVIMDIITNHTADVIQYEGGNFNYRPIVEAPYRDAAGKVFKVGDVAYNGLNDPGRFPALDPQRSFAYVPVVPEAEKNAKGPAWLNDVTLYHNRGNSLFMGENSVHGDFVGLDDIFTEHPRVVRGLIDVFSQWLDYGIDGYRIDTVRHVNNEFWQAFSPAIRARARELGRRGFLQFAEVYNEAGDPSTLAEFSTNVVPIDTTIDFGFFAAARRYVSQAGTAAALADFFIRDDYYTDHDSNVHATTTFLGNHDAGRFGYFLREDNTGASPGQLADLVRLGHGLLYLSRGQPVLYYGDEQGMIGRGGHDMQARESLFASRAPDFRDAPLLATTRTGADDKYDRDHPFYRFFSQLGRLRAEHVALRTGAMIPRFTTVPAIAAFSRVDRTERVEYLAVFNNSRTKTLRAAVPTSQPAGARLLALFDSFAPEGVPAAAVTAAEGGAVEVELAPLQFKLWRAERPLASTGAPLQVAFTTPVEGGAFSLGSREIDGLKFPLRREIRAEVTGGDGVGEMTFALRRSSRPHQLDYLGTDDNAPYRIFWSPPADLGPGETFELIATYSDLRGRSASATVGGITLQPTQSPQGIAHSRTPAITRGPSALALAAGAALELSIEAEGSGPLDYQWLRNGEEIPGANAATYTVASAGAADAGAYRVLVSNVAGTALSAEAVVTVSTPAPGDARIVRHAQFPSRHVAARHIDVWLPPGYDAARETRYPVIYLHDGQNMFDPSGPFGSWRTDDAMLRLMDAGEVPPAILVGVWNTPARFAEYMPQQATSEAVLAEVLSRFRLPASRLQSDAYLKFLVEELKPFIDRTYRTQTGRDHTFVMGSSMGGLISAYAMVQHPDVFGGAGCVSIHWPVGDGVIVDYLARHLPPPKTHKFYFDFGTLGLDAAYEPYQRRMDDAMRAAGYTEGRLWMTRKFDGADHNETSWRARVHLPLKFLLTSS